MIIFVTGFRHPDPKQVPVQKMPAWEAYTRAVVRRLVKHKVKIMTSNLCGVESVVISESDHLHYTNLEVWIYRDAGGGYESVFGTNVIKAYAQAQIDSVLIDRTDGLLVVNHRGNPHEKIITYARNRGKRVVVKTL